MRFSSPGQRDFLTPERVHALLTQPADAPRPPADGGAPPGHMAGDEPLRVRRGPPAMSFRSGPLPPDAPTGAERPSLAQRIGARGLGRLDPGIPGARALAVVALIAAILAGVYLWMSRPRPQPVPEVRSSYSAAPVLATNQTATTAASVIVQVGGKVRHPGVLTLPPGSRVTDAIKAAGGLRPDTETGSLNLARRIVDGEQILVGVPTPSAPPPGATSPGSPPTQPATQLDLNAATLDQFQQLPGVGPVLAQRIVDYRTQHGGFRTVEQLREVTGIGTRRYADLKDLVRT